MPDQHIDREVARAEAGSKSLSSSNASDKALGQEYQWYLDRLRKRHASPPSVQTALGLSASPRLKNARTAMLVIHGIGEQSPYETLDQFARNLLRYLKFEGGIQDLTLSPRHMDHNDWQEAFVRLSTEQYGPSGTPAIIDVHEYYWAPATEGKMTYAEVLRWLIQTVWEAIRGFRSNVAEQQQAGKWDPGSGLDPRSVVRRELTRMLWLYFPLLFVFGCSLFWMNRLAQQNLGLIGFLLGLWHAAIHSPVTSIGGGLLLVLGAGFALPVLRQAWRWFLRTMRQHSSMETHLWIVGQALLAAACFAAGSYLFRRSLLYEALAARDTWLLASAGFGWLMKSVLQNFVADVAVYTNLDEKAKNFAARELILEGSTLALARLLREQKIVTRDGGHETVEYDSVVIAGHSLGSVIAYDALNHLCNHASGGPDQVIGKIPAANISTQQLRKITGLITFGSPLDKVYYFFREKIPGQQSVRAQVISYLYSLRKMPSGRDYGIYEFTPPYQPNKLDGLQWLNAWSRDDPISGALHFYGPMERREFRYLIPLYAHLSYWEDLRFYDFFAAPLLLGSTPQNVVRTRAAAV